MLCRTFTWAASNSWKSILFRMWIRNQTRYNHQKHFVITLRKIYQDISTFTDKLLMWQCFNVFIMGWHALELTVGRWMVIDRRSSVCGCGKLWTLKSCFYLFLVERDKSVLKINERKTISLSFSIHSPFSLENFDQITHYSHFL